MTYSVFTNIRGILQDRTKIWATLTHSARHVPKSHMLLIAGDCNAPLSADAPLVSTADPKFSQAA